MTAGTNEAAQAGPVGPEDNRHVAGEIDRADGVGIVVDVRRMQPRFAAIAPRPFGLGTDQPHAGAAGVVVNLPAAAKNVSMSSRVKKSGAPCGP